MRARALNVAEDGDTAREFGLCCKSHTQAKCRANESRDMPAHARAPSVHRPNLHASKQGRA